MPSYTTIAKKKSTGPTRVHHPTSCQSIQQNHHDDIFKAKRRGPPCYVHKSQLPVRVGSLRKGSASDHVQLHATETPFGFSNSRRDAKGVKDHRNAVENCQRDWNGAFYPKRRKRGARWNDSWAWWFIHYLLNSPTCA